MACNSGSILNGKATYGILCHILLDTIGGLGSSLPPSYRTKRLINSPSEKSAESLGYFQGSLRDELPGALAGDPPPRGGRFGRQANSAPAIGQDATFSSFDLSHPVAPEQSNPSAQTCQCPTNQKSGEFNHVGIELALRWVHTPEAAAPWARSRAIAKETATGEKPIVCIGRKHEL